MIRLLGITMVGIFATGVLAQQTALPEPNGLTRSTVYPSSALAMPEPAASIPPPSRAYCDTCDEDDAPARLWFQADYLLWFLRSDSLPPLVSVATSNGNGNVYPNGSINHGGFSGVRGTAGMWLDDERTIGIEGGYFWLAPQHQTFGVASLGQVQYQRPVIMLNDGNQIFNFPVSGGGIIGGITTDTKTSLMGAEANILIGGPDVKPDGFDFLVGFRYLDLSERVQINDTSGAIGFGTLSSYDRFTTRNQFYGGQIGTRIRVLFGENWRSDLGIKLALGGLQAEAESAGGTVLQGTNAPPFGVPVGLLTAGTVRGMTQTRTVFMPEVNWALTCRLSEHIRFTAGYNFLYLTEVLRPGGVVDTTVNTTFIPFGPTAGSGIQHRGLRSDFTDLWAQGLNLGLSFEY